MLTEFWNSLGEGLSEKWLEKLGPALVFWGSGLFLFFGTDGIEELLDDLSNHTTVTQVAWLVTGLIILSVSTYVVTRLTFPVLRILEGYWPNFLFPLGNGLRNKHKTKVIDWEYEHQRLRKKGDIEGLTDREKFRKSQLEMKLRYVPSPKEGYMPTKLGNILKASESKPRSRFGLDAVVCWPRLWPLLSEDLQDALQKSRGELNQSIEYILWGWLFVFWGLAHWGAIPLGILFAIANYQLAINNAKTYADLIATAFDLHRWDLYKAFHLELPSSPEDEKELGDLITRIIWKGDTGKKVTYKHL